MIAGWCQSATAFSIFSSTAPRIRTSHLSQKPEDETARLRRATVSNGVAKHTAPFILQLPGCDRSAIEQAHDYALDLKNFHRGSHNLPIVPIVVATRAKPDGAQEPQ
jgi:hypothetical protein